MTQPNFCGGYENSLVQAIAEIISEEHGRYISRPVPAQTIAETWACKAAVRIAKLRPAPAPSVPPDRSEQQQPQPKP